ncbi:MAG: 4-hydroxyphenylacetate 3-hydroxylase N-terminal domain-containing protein [Candidatus Binataceae bacterium]
MESIHDSPGVWIYGERVKDVTRHPAFRNTAQMLARMYDSLHDRKSSRFSPPIPIPGTVDSRTNFTKCREARSS